MSLPVEPGNGGPPLPDFLRWTGLDRLFSTGRGARFAQSFLWLLSDRILRLGVGLVVGLAIARELGPEQFGVLSYAIAAAGLGSVVAGLGLDGIVQRDLVRSGEGGWNTILGTAFVLRLVAGVLLYVAYAAIISITAERTDLRVACLIIGLTLILNPVTLFDAWFQAQVASKYAVLAQNIGFVVATALRVLLLVLDEITVPRLAVIAVLELTVGGLALAASYRRRSGLPLLRWKWDAARAKAWGRESWTQLLSGLAIFVYMRIDQIMLEQLAGATAVGIYSAAVRISEIGYFIPVVLGSTLLPSVVRTEASDPQKYVQRRQHYFDVSTLLAVAFAAPTSLFAWWLVPMLFGVDYVEAAPILAIHAWSALLVFSGIARGQYLLTEGLLRFSFFATLAGAIMNVLLNLVFIPRWGGVGAAWATLLSHTAAALISSFVWPPCWAMGKQQMKALLIPVAALRLARSARSGLRE